MEMSFDQAQNSSKRREKKGGRKKQRKAKKSKAKADRRKNRKTKKTHAMNNVLLFPPSASCSSRVNLDER